MIKPIITIILIAVLSAAHGQEFLKNYNNEVDAQGRKQGNWVTYDGNGNIKYEGAFKDDKPVGEFKYYYPDGQVKAIVNHNPVTGEVYAVNYYKNGLLMARGKYINQAKDSTWLYFSEIDETIVSEEHWDRGKKVGEWKTYYPSGQVMEVTQYKNGVKEGKWIQYFSDGTKKAEATYVNNELEGLMQIFYITGKVEVSGTYKNSTKNGIWMYFNEIGEAEKKEVYKDGVLIEPE
jgi:antitoxin component YwqK of YwqJK toxin-antitoxin module